ncbi:NADH oxidase family-domain-containing protein [Mycena olivaceomarginata]|nr:NADH oxidase family-domain-containing protein [Mycena olivaceomarginata]
MSTPKLFQPIQIGNIQLAHRVVFAPVTRFRADENHTSLPHVEDYYEQRASTPGSFLVSEATLIAERAAKHAPGIWSDEHIAAWKRASAPSQRQYVLLTCFLLRRSWIKCMQRNLSCTSSCGRRVGLAPTFPTPPT